LFSVSGIELSPSLEHGIKNSPLFNVIRVKAAVVFAFWSSLSVNG